MNMHKKHQKNRQRMARRFLIEQLSARLPLAADIITCDEMAHFGYLPAIVDEVETIDTELETVDFEATDEIGIELTDLEFDPFICTLPYAETIDEVADDIDEAAECFVISETIEVVSDPDPAFVEQPWICGIFDADLDCSGCDFGPEVIDTIDLEDVDADLGTTIICDRGNAIDEDLLVDELDSIDGLEVVDDAEYLEESEVVDNVTDVELENPDVILYNAVADDNLPVNTWCNTIDPADVNQDGHVSILDAHMIVIAINAYGAVNVSELEVAQASQSFVMETMTIDANNDFSLNDFDLQLVVGRLGVVIDILEETDNTSATRMAFVPDFLSVALRL
jgi:hypothetical protein